MTNKRFASILVVVLCLTMFVTSALAVEPGDERVTLGADLTEKQINQIYIDFGLERGSVKEITVTNDEERTYLAGLVPDKKIGKVALSCIYIKTLDEGSGITVSTHNINWCTPGMYMNALVTAGVSDARVMVSAPFDVSGTAALTGVYKAYEDMTGTSLDETAKEAAAVELVITGELAETIGSDDATQLINELKKILDQTRNMSDEELRAEIIGIAERENIELTEENIEQLISLCRTLEQVDISDWGEKLSQLSETMKNVQKTTEGVSTFFESVGKFFDDLFAGIGGFFSNLFG